MQLPETAYSFLTIFCFCLGNFFNQITVQHSSRKSEPVSACGKIDTILFAGEPCGTALSHQDLVNVFRFPNMFPERVRNFPVFLFQDTFFFFVIEGLPSFFCVRDRRLSMHVSLINGGIPLFTGERGDEAQFKRCLVFVFFV